MLHKYLRSIFERYTVEDRLCLFTIMTAISAILACNAIWSHNPRGIIGASIALPAFGYLAVSTYIEYKLRSILEHPKP